MSFFLFFAFFLKIVHGKHKDAEIYFDSNSANNNHSIKTLNEILESINQKVSTPTNIVFDNAYGDTAFMHSTEKHFSYDKMRSKTLRIIVPGIEPPYVNYVNFSDAAVVEKGYGPGVVMEILKEIGRRLNLTYEVIDNPETTWGELMNGSWTGAFGRLIRGDADLLAGGAIMEYDRSLVSDLTYPFQFEPTGIMIRSPEKYEDDTLLIVTEPFSWQVWVITAISIGVSGVIFLVMTNVLSQVYREMSVTLFESTWVFFSIFVQQGLPEQPRSWSCRVLIALWWLASITLSATFTGSLVALFAVDKTNLPFQNIEQLVKAVKQGRFEIVMDENSFTRTEMIARSKLPVYKDLWHEMNVNHRVKYVNGIAKGVAFVRTNPGYALLGPMETLNFYAYSDCKVILLSDGILPVYLSIPLAKDSLYTAYFSTKIREMVERGFTQKWISDYKSYVATQKINECNSTTTGPKSYLDLKRAQGAFWVLIGGIGIGSLIFIIEFIVLFARRNMKAEIKTAQVAITQQEQVAVPSQNLSGNVSENQKPETLLRRRNVLNLTLNISES
ncbi:unnamed protein product [Caenorhabditis angaria]|uniref:Ionotropic glutamate receptor L-glutamate and glycine-binding domain-containing protein n=1 Tax=Caenorhabditis angaria TaxID=860376 RepID=A0A9P1J578_9PELO|nr:unnamed protein product [Caenorhabditis angaria]